MIRELVEKKERKVEYIELIYDLIFVYMIGRNNSLLHSFSGGFVELAAFAAYVLTALAVGVIFAGAMLLLRRSMVLNIALTVAFIAFLFGLIYWYGRQIDAA